MGILISWLHQKPADLALHGFQNWEYNLEIVIHIVQFSGPDNTQSLKQVLIRHNLSPPRTLSRCCRFEDAAALMS